MVARTIPDIGWRAPKTSGRGEGSGARRQGGHTPVSRRDRRFPPGGWANARRTAFQPRRFFTTWNHIPKRPAPARRLLHPLPGQRLHALPHLVAARRALDTLRPTMLAV